MVKKSGPLKRPTVPGQKGRIRPRGPGLDFVNPHNRAETLEERNRRLVEEAEGRLRNLLSDPYYYEAFRQLMAREDPCVALSGVRLGQVRGNLAGRLQRPPEPPMPAGRPPRRSLHALLKGYESGVLLHKLGMASDASIIAFARKVISVERPDLAAAPLEYAARQLAAGLRRLKSQRSRA
jgi:hypothetical protein